jgi:hypothetical protein
MDKTIIDHGVRLTHDLPELGLPRGTHGKVCSLWCAPQTAYEVEFEVAGSDRGIRALLREEQIQPDEEDPEISLDK